MVMLHFGTSFRFAWLPGLLLLAGSALGCGGDDTSSQTTNPPVDELEVDKAVVGKLLYFDTNLSSPSGQACASCHDPESGYAEPHADLPVSQGVLSWLVGNRNAPSAAYAKFSPPFHRDEAEQMYVGGQFWDGRASTLVDQAKGPFLNPLEMHNDSKATVVAAVKASAYADLFERVFGEGSLNTPETAYDKIAEAIAEYESSDELNRFSSKYDLVTQGKAAFTDAEQRGKDLFEGKAKCADCHSSKPFADGTHALFTDFTYDNLGVPKNLALPFYNLPPEYNPQGASFVDRGLGGALKDPMEDGKFKVPTLRNIAKTAPYMHNGVFNTLAQVVDFYSTRDIKPDWGPPEVPENVNTTELGTLGLTEGEIADLVEFLETLTDGYVPPGK